MIQKSEINHFNAYFPFRIDIWYYFARFSPRKRYSMKEINGELFWVGHTADYVKVAIKTDQNMANCLKKVFVTEFLTDEILKCNSLD